MSFIEAACRNTAFYVSLESAARSKDAPNADEKSLKKIGVLSISLRKLLGKATCDMSTQHTVSCNNNTDTEVLRERPERSSDYNSRSIQIVQYIFDAADGLSLDKSQSAPSKQEKALNQMI